MLTLKLKEVKGMKKLTLAAVMIAICLPSLAQDIDHIDANTPRDLQVRITMLAAPQAVSDHADVYILSKKGYEMVKRGDNGFSCLIERERPGTMEPVCYDAAGSKTTFKVTLSVEDERARGVREEEIERSIRAGYKSGKFLPPAKAGIVYMLSDYNYVLNPETGQIIHFPGHLMFYAPYATEKTVGTGEGAPYIVHPGKPDTLMTVVPAKIHSHN
jgi:hypothetical protein